MDYNIANIFVGNTDWPGNNNELFRMRRDHYEPNAPYGQDGRFRYVMKDTDFGFHLYNTDHTHNTLAFATDASGTTWPNPHWTTLMLRNMLENAGFRNAFINRSADLMNTRFRSGHILDLIDETADRIRKEMPHQIERWQRPSNMDHWENAVNRMRNFAIHRPQSLRSHYLSFFNLHGMIEATIQVDDPATGHVHLNSIDIHDSTPGIDTHTGYWTGLYFDGIPVTVSAVPAGWLCKRPHRTPCGLLLSYFIRTMECSGEKDRGS